MAKNRFEQVDELQPDAINLTLIQKSDGQVGIVRLQLDRIGRRIRENQDAKFVYDDAVVDHIVSMCNDPDTGGRMIDNIITNTLLPALSREFLKRSLAREKLKEAKVMIENDDFAYGWA